ncbi:hypothetical protein CDN99_14090 [Roseateles aquatilis]|uniref:Uncharacterized protein n=1 Tax=Roseateles aquatilis TaxID=431061 RepID=A0A246JCV7_9BURK|nr:hypothetical protein [Roseateles aquatilis]OWQ90473.1 hypothetical protein CDN99_14090 [Roseateles aquatilis]
MSGHPVAKPAFPAATRLSLLLGAATIALGACAQPAPPPPPASEGFSAGVTFDAKDDGANLDVPLYPGATPYKERGEDKSSVRMDLWGGLFGMQLAAGKFQSGDDADRVARFYRKALARYGTLLDCGDLQAPRGKAKDGGPLTCEDDKPEPGGQLYKVGLPKNFRVVAVKPLKDGTTRIDVARVRFR